MLTARKRLAATFLSLAVLAPAAPAVAAGDPTAFVKTVQTTPVKVGGKVRSVVGQAAITRGGTLVIRIAGPNEAGVDGEAVLAQTKRRIRGLVSNLSRAKLTMKLNRDRTGSVVVIGARNAEEPDSVLSEFTWRAGEHPKVQITQE